MKTYNDAVGRSWSVDFTVQTFRKTRAAFGDLLEPEYFLKKTSDPVFMVDLLFEIAKGQCDELGVNAEQFASAFYGDAVEEARKTLLEAYVDFFPSRARETMQAALKKIDELQAEFMKNEAKKLEEITLERASATAGEDASSN